MTDTWGSDTVLMPVPLQWAGRVAALLADLRAGKVHGPDDEVRDGSTVTVPGQGSWTEAMVTRLADAVSYRGVLALLDACAQVDGDWVVKSVVEEDEGISPIQLRNELGALSKLTRRLFGEVKWPVEWKKEQGKYHYRMAPQMAEWWLSARGVGG